VNIEGTSWQGDTVTRGINLGDTLARGHVGKGRCEDATHSRPYLKDSWEGQPYANLRYQPHRPRFAVE
jgi:hypothetical protein